MKISILLFIFTLNLQSVFTQEIPDQWLTKAEKTNFLETSRYQETIEYCKKLSKESQYVHYTTFGKSGEDRDLPLLLVSKDKIFDPKKAARTSKTIILIQNGIHSGEIEGKDASLMLVRDIVITKRYFHLLDSLILLIIPIYNVDGHERFSPYNRINQNGPKEMGWRTNATNLNLNRDYMKAEAPETRAFLKLFTSWLPDFFIDVHTTNGADYQYVLTYSIDYQENVSIPVRKWITENFLPDVLKRLEQKGYPAAPYIWLKDNKDPSKGMFGGISPPRLSNSYVTLHNRPGLLIETHMLKNYQQRVEGVYQFLVSVLEHFNINSSSLKYAVRFADQLTIESLNDPFPLKFEPTGEADSLLFLGFKAIIETSSVSGTEWVTWTDQPMSVVIPWYNKVRVKTSVTPPKAYLIPRQWKNIIDVLRLHGIQVEVLKQPVEIDAEYYRFKNPYWQEKPYEGRHPVSFSLEKNYAKKKFNSGTFLIRLNQRTAKLAIHLLEPEAPDALVTWGYFDSIFEQKEYAEQYVLEKLAREMLKNNPSLKQEFEELIERDAEFAKNPQARLNFFYQRSPYWDQEINLYPVVRSMQEIDIPTEIYK